MPQKENTGAPGAAALDGDHRIRDAVRDHFIAAFRESETYYRDPEGYQGGFEGAEEEAAEDPRLAALDDPSGFYANLDHCASAPYGDDTGAGSPITEALQDAVCLVLNAFSQARSASQQDSA